MKKFENLITKNNFFYKQFFNIKNDSSVQNTIDRNGYKNKNKNRKYRENRRRKNEISREKIKEFKNNNFINFSKINCFKCLQKKHYVRNCIVFAFVNKSQKKFFNVVSIASI